MRLSKTIFFLALLCAYTKVSAQLSTHEQPVSFDSKLKLTVLSKSSNPTIIMPSLDMAKIEAEDKEDKKKDVPPRFGYSHYVHYDLTNSGTWYNLPDGDKLWQLNIVCPGALSVNFCYDKFWIPEGGKFFIYTKDQKQAIGAFTNRNNKGDKNHVSGFATELLFSSDVVLEYYQPQKVTEDAVISINRIVHGYRSFRDDIPGYGQSGSCQVDINCPEGQDWKFEKNAVALILVDGVRHASGALINTTDFGGKPYFLTAHHNLTDGKDAETDSILNNYIFWWNYEKSGCNNTSSEPVPFTTTGAIVVANDSYSDFALLKLAESPQDIIGYTPYYLGWDCTGNTGTTGVCIHHPYGDVKKISTVKTTPIPVTYNYPGYTHWEVTWKLTPTGHGTTQRGSSGSPLLNGEHRVIGQQQGGTSSCDYPNDPDWFGRFDVSWTNENDPNIHRRLDYWLNPQNTTSNAIDGLLLVTSTDTLSTDNSLYGNIRITNTGQLTVQGQVELIGNGKVIVDAGGKLIIDGGRLSNVDIELKAGATLRIKNGGILEYQNEFIAPVGAIVKIENGQIL